MQKLLVTTCKLSQKSESQFAICCCSFFSQGAECLCLRRGYSCLWLVTRFLGEKKTDAGGGVGADSEEGGGGGGGEMRTCCLCSTGGSRGCSSSVCERRAKGPAWNGGGERRSTDASGKTPSCFTTTTLDSVLMEESQSRYVRCLSHAHCVDLLPFRGSWWQAKDRGHSSFVQGVALW